MANDVTIFVRSKGDDGRGFDNQASRAKGLKGRLSGLTSGFRGVAAAGAAFAAVDMFRSAIEGARESAKVTKVTQAVIKSTGGVANVTAAQVGKLATAISNKTAVDDEAIQASSNLLLTFKGVRNEVGKGNDIFNRAQRAIVDMTAAMNNGRVTEDGLKASTIQVGKALNDPIKGMTALSRVGVTFSDKQKEVIRHLVETGQKAKAQKLILKELAEEFGGAAEAAATPVDKLKTKVGNLGEAIGAKLLPHIDHAATGLSKMADWGEKNQDWIVPTTAALIALAGAIKGVSMVQSAISLGPWGLLLSAVFALAAGLVILYKRSETARDVMGAMWEHIARTGVIFAGQVVKAFRVMMQGVLEAIGGIAHGAALAFGWIPGIGKKLKAADKAFRNFKDSAVDKLKGIEKALHEMDEHLKGSNDRRKLRADVRQLVAAVDKAKGQLNSVPKEKRSKIKVDIANALSKIRDAQRKINAVHGKTVHIGVTFDPIPGRRTGGSDPYGKYPGLTAHGGIIGAQGGGPRSRQTIVGEHGPELVDLAPGSTVHSNPDTRRMLTQPQGGGTDHLVLEFAGGSGSDLERLIWDWIKENVRIRGGKGPNSVQKALGA